MYKRQAVISVPLPHKRFKFSQRHRPTEQVALVGLATVFFQKIKLYLRFHTFGNHVPVSYTHLDVYKRQVIRKMVIGLLLFAGLRALLKGLGIWV